MFPRIVFLVSWLLSVNVVTAMQCQCTCTSPDNPKEKYVATMNNNTFAFNAVKMEEAIALNRTEMVKHRKDKAIKPEQSDKTINQTTNDSSQPNANLQQYKLNNVWDVIGNQKNKKIKLQKKDKSVNTKEKSYNSNVSQSLDNTEKQNKGTTRKHMNSGLNVNVWGQLKTGVKNNVLQHVNGVGKGHINPNNFSPSMRQLHPKVENNVFNSIHQPKGNTMYRNSNNWMHHKNRNNNILEFPAWKPFRPLTAQSRTHVSQTVNTNRQEPGHTQWISTDETRYSQTVNTNGQEFRHTQWTNQVESTNTKNVEIEPVEREVR